MWCLVRYLEICLYNKTTLNIYINIIMDILIELGIALTILTRIFVE